MGSPSSNQTGGQSATLMIVRGYTGECRINFSKESDADYGEFVDAVFLRKVPIHSV